MTKQQLLIDFNLSAHVPWILT